MRGFALLPCLALLLPSLGCDLSLDATKPVPPALARRIAQAEAAGGGIANTIEVAGLYLEAGRYFDAANAYKTAQTNGADTAAVHAGLAQTYLELGYFQACAEQLRACFQKNRDEPGCLYVFGSLMEGIDDRQALEESQRAYSRLLQLAPNFRKAKLAKSSLDQVEARLRSMGAPPQQPASRPAAPAGAAPADPHAGVVGAPPAIGEAPKAPADGHPPGVDPNTGEDVGALNPFGQAIMKAIDAVRRNDAPAAELAFQAALKIRPNDPAALAGLAEAQFAQGKRDAAVQTIGAAYTADPKDPQVRWAFGRIMIEVRQRTDEAVAAWEALIAEEPDYAKQLGVPERLEALKKYDK